MYVKVHGLAYLLDSHHNFADVTAGDKEDTQKNVYIILSNDDDA